MHLKINPAFNLVYLHSLKLQTKQHPENTP